MSDDDFSRIDRLEMRLAEQDRVIDDLNSTILQQWKRIEDLARRLDKLSERVQVVEDATPEAPDRPPPHY